MQNSVIPQNSIEKRRLRTFIVCLLGLALAGGGGCQTLQAFHPPIPGKRAEKVAKGESNKSESYYHYLKAQRYLMDDDILNAIQEYEEAAKSDPNSADLQIELAILYQRHGELSKALAHVEKALKIHTKNAEAHFLLAGLH